MTERIGGARRLAYCLGSAGYLISDRVVMSIALYYYLPPAGRGLVPLLSSDLIFGFISVYGLAMFAGRIFACIAGR